LKEGYYPAFYAAPDLDRVQLERVSQALQGLNLAPLEALMKPEMFGTVLCAADGFAER